MADTPSNDKYIRTFAKDAALLQGQPLPSSPVSNGSGVVTEETRESNRDAVLERLKSRAAKDPVSEGQLLPDTLPTPVAIPENKDAPAQIPTSAESVPKTEKPSEAWKPGDLPTYAPQTPIPNVYREAVPEITTLPNVEPVIQAPRPEPVPVPKPVVDEGPSPLHTYSSDFSDRIDTNKASTFSVLAAQSDAQAAPVREEKEEKASPSRKTILVVASSVLLLIIAGGISYAAYRYVAIKTFVPFVQTVPSLVFADERVPLTGEGSSLQNALVSSLSNTLPNGKVRVFYLTEASSTPARGAFTVTLPGGRLIGALQLTAPDILLRNIAPESTIGAVGAGGDTRVFFILRVLSYERTFAGMLSWEATMADSLSLFYPSYPVPPPPPPTIVTTTKIVKGKRVTATTTVETPVPPYVAPRFIDEIASNHNVRALKDMDGKTILLYGYTEKDTLIIARDEAAFAELINRLSATKQQ